MAMKIFPRRALGLIILSILDEHPEGLTGYAIVKEIIKKFKPINRISPGTVYPKLERLKDRGNIFEEGKLYKISSQGKSRLTQKIPELIENNLEFMPILYKILIRSLPFRHRMNFLSNIGPFFCCSRPSSHRNLFDDFLLSEDLKSKIDILKSVEKLQVLKEQLLQVKAEIQERVKAGFKAIDEKIQIINKKIKNYQQEKVNWTKIIIEDGDSQEG